MGKKRMTILRVDETTIEAYMDRRFMLFYVKGLLNEDEENQTSRGKWWSPGPSGADKGKIHQGGEEIEALKNAMLIKSIAILSPEEIEKPKDINDWLEENKDRVCPEITFGPEAAGFLRETIAYLEAFVVVQENANSVKRSVDKLIEFFEHTIKEMERPTAASQ